MNKKNDSFDLAVYFLELTLFTRKETNEATKSVLLHLLFARGKNGSSLLLSYELMSKSYHQVVSNSTKNNFNYLLVPIFLGHSRKQLILIKLQSFGIIFRLTN